MLAASIEEDAGGEGRVPDRVGSARSTAPIIEPFIAEDCIIATAWTEKTELRSYS